MARAELSVLRQQNACAPIGVLPTELLGEIFKFCISKAIKEGEFSHRWLWLGHICHRWREVALQTALLWTRISLLEYTQHPERVLEMLVRSGNAALDLHIECPTVTPTVKALVLAIPRARFVHYRSSNQTADDLTPIIPHIAPHLTAVKLVGDVAVHLFSECETVQLQRITINASSFSSEPRFLQGTSITRLDLSGGGWIPHSPAIFLVALKNLPGLKWFFLNGEFTETIPVNDNTTVSLPCMTYISLRSLTFPILAFLYERIKVPATARVYLDLTNMYEDEAEEAEALIDAIAAHFRELDATSGTRIRAFAFNFTDTRAHEVELQIEAPSIKGFVTGKKYPHLRVGVAEDSSPALDILFDILGSVSLIDVSSVFLHSPYIYYEHDERRIRTEIISLLRDSPKITTVCFIGEQPSEWMPSFLLHHESTGPAPDHSVTSQRLLPQLSALYISDANFRPPALRINRSKPSLYANELVDLLSDRARAGCPVQRVILADSVGIWKDDVEAMRRRFMEEEMSCEVLWDGIRCIKRWTDFTAYDDSDSDGVEEEARSDDEEDFIGIENFIDMI
ncbi:hypothetical protein EIP91_005479 [Steccherinum ochraceum]|uniref:Uncharacterized protein n=1 Tax=Steccherinum ochraceum TaxID=92696 RepID=A0A4R0RVL2_9APHY|nr:hypothetical protein EIP91_005479 [Steccherinum ochraceum]